jgi:hypothetical protein
MVRASEGHADSQALPDIAKQIRHATTHHGALPYHQDLQFLELTRVWLYPQALGIKDFE